MSKRRTRKEKERARHRFIISQRVLLAEPKKVEFEANVKRQFTKPAMHPNLEKGQEEKSINTQETLNLALIKKDIIKSLILASLILASELVIYFLWSS